MPNSHSFYATSFAITSTSEPPCRRSPRYSCRRSFTGGGLGSLAGAPDSSNEKFSEDQFLIVLAGKSDRADSESRVTGLLRMGPAAWSRVEKKLYPDIL